MVDLEAEEAILEDEIEVIKGMIQNEKKKYERDEA
jgi:hypothetical protein